MTKLAVVRETRENEKRVAITPELAGELTESGIEVMIESGAGEQAGFKNEDYQAYGAGIAHSKKQLYRDANIVCWFKRPQQDQLEIQHMDSQTTLIGFLDPLKPGQHMQTYTNKQIMPFSWELLPSHPELKTMDAFAEMGKLAGKVAYQNARDTAKAANKHKLIVMVIGTGNAGMAAAENAHADGQQLVVVGTNINAQNTIEQTLASTYVALPNSRLSNPQDLLLEQQHQLQALIERCQPDIIITSARRYGKQAPLLLPATSLTKLQPGTIIEDLTASIGGNTAYTQMDKAIETPNGVLIRNRSNYPSQHPQQASRLYASCLAKLFQKARLHNCCNFKQNLLRDPLLSKAVWQNNRTKVDEAEFQTSQIKLNLRCAQETVRQ